MSTVQLRNVFGNRFYLGLGYSLAPDAYVWLLSYLLTALSVLACTYFTSDQWSSPEWAFSVFIVFLNNWSAVVLLIADPGILPRRLGVGEATAGRPEGKVCSVCKVERPERTHHCYTCDVCIVGHDHHCKLLGVCIGRRSMRWFILYLLTTNTQFFYGLFLLIRSFKRLPVEGDWKKRPPPDNARTWSPSARRAFDQDCTFKLLGHLLVMALIATLLLPVLAGTITYIILPLSGTSWREARVRGIVPVASENKGRQRVTRWLSAPVIAFTNLIDVCKAEPSRL